MMSSQPQQRDIEVLTGANYYPVGISPRQKDVADPLSKTTDVFLLLKELMKRPQPTYLVIANAQSHRDKSALEEAEQIMYESIQEIIAEDQGLTSHVEVVVLSELIDDQKFQALYQQVVSLAQTDPQFAAMVYECVPANYRPRAHRRKAYHQLPPTSIPAAFKAMDYVFQQIAQVILMNGRKLGHQLEEAYNDVTIEAARRLNLPTANLTFETIDLAEATGTVPYRAVGQKIDETRDGLLSAQADLGLLSESWLFREAELDRRYDAIQNKTKLMNRLYSKMLDKAPAHLHDVLKFRFAREVITTLIHGPRPIYRFLFESTGLLDYLRGTITIDEFESQTCLLPFSCPRLPNESEHAYILRYIDALLHNDGPVIPTIKRTGIQALKCQRLHQLAPDHNPGGWHEFCKHYFDELFFQTGLIRGVPIEEIAQRSHQVLQDLFDIITGTDLENIYNNFFGSNFKMPPERELPRGNHQALRQLMQSPLWSEHFRRHVLNHLD